MYLSCVEPKRSVYHKEKEYQRLATTYLGLYGCTSPIEEKNKYFRGEPLIGRESAREDSPLRVGE